MRRMREYRSSGLGRPLTLLRAFLVASAVDPRGRCRRALLPALGRSHGAPRLPTAHATWPRTRTRCSRRSSSRGTRVRVDAARAAASRSTIRLPEDVRGLNVYARDGRLAFSTTRPDRIGRRRTSPDLTSVVRTNVPSAQVVDPLGKAAPVVKVWAPLHTRGVGSWAPPRCRSTTTSSPRRRRRRSGRSGTRWGSSSVSSGSPSRSWCEARPRGCERRTTTSPPARTTSSSRHASSKPRCSRRSRRSTPQSRRATRIRRATRSGSDASRSPSGASCVSRRGSSARSRRRLSSTTSGRSGCRTRS